MAGSSHSRVSQEYEPGHPKIADQLLTIPDEDEPIPENSVLNQNPKMHGSKTSFLSERNENRDLIAHRQDHGPKNMHHHFTDFRIACGKAINDPRVQLFIVVLIGINAIMMGIGTFPFVKDDPKVSDAFQLVDTIFLSIFTVELALQFIYLGWKMFKDGWLCFDFVIIVVSWAFAEAQIIRAFRIFRALRLVTRVKIMKDLVVAIFGVLPKMAAISLMLFLISYIFAVMMTQLFHEMNSLEPTPSYDYFSRLDRTFFTLFQMMTLDAWADVARETMNIQTASDSPNVYEFAWIPFLLFVTITGFVIVNLMIAVICDAVANLEDADAAAILGGAGDDENKKEYAGVMEQYAALDEKFDKLAKLQRDNIATLNQMRNHWQMRKLNKGTFDINNQSSKTYEDSLQSLQLHHLSGN